MFGKRTTHSGHFDAADEAFPAELPQALARKIDPENASEFYRL